MGLKKGNRVQWRLTTSCHGHIIGDKAMKVRMLHCELKWEIPIKSLKTDGGIQWNGGLGFS
jgi:hypothetical protein